LTDGTGPSSLTRFDLKAKILAKLFGGTGEKIKLFTLSKRTNL